MLRRSLTLTLHAILLFQEVTGGEELPPLSGHYLGHFTKQVREKAHFHRWAADVAIRNSGLPIRNLFCCNNLQF